MSRISASVLRHGLVPTTIAAMCAWTPPAVGQTAPLTNERVWIGQQSGEIEARAEAGASSAPAREAIFRDLVSVADASWVRLYFGDVRLSGSTADGNHSIIRLTSLRDGAVQLLDAQSLRQWNGSSAYFNGNVLLVELLAYPGTGPNRLAVESADAGASGEAESLCESDDRTPGGDPRVGRILPIGCTGFLVDANSPACVLTAGHCAYDMSVLEFNVPASSSYGSINFAHPDDQYPVDPASIQFRDGSVGNDWCYFGCFPNSNTGRFASEVQGIGWPVGEPPLADGTGIVIDGYGVDYDDPSRTQTLQTEDGTYDDISANAIYYDDLDTMGGNSGSPIIKTNIDNSGTDAPIGIHTHGGCSYGANKGTRSDNAGLQAALAFPQGICATATSCTWDLDGDHAVGFHDLTVLLRTWGRLCSDSVVPCTGLDPLGDDRIGFEELAELLGTWGSCPDA